MKKSNLERYSDNTIWKLISILTKDDQLMSEFKSFEHIWDDADFCHTTQRILKPLGVEAKDELDCEFIFQLIDKNIIKIREKNFSGELKRPEIKMYVFDVDENSRDYVVRTYRNKRLSYDMNTIKNILRSEDFYPSEGREVYYEIYDSDVTETRIENIEIEKINESFDQKSELKKLLSERQKIDHKIRKLLK